jgi:hypothetical protein
MTGERVEMARALARTTVKLLPWETTYLLAFALMSVVNQKRCQERS